MTVVSAAITVSAIFASGVIGGVVGLVTVAIHREERHHTLIRPAPDRATSAARGLNGVYVHAPAAAEARHRGQETPA
jgi:Flp pilus assembly protein protease CpaA